jgi:hypothetical protein
MRTLPELKELAARRGNTYTVERKNLEQLLSALEIAKVPVR